MSSFSPSSPGPGRPGRPDRSRPAVVVGLVVAILVVAAAAATMVPGPVGGDVTRVAGQAPLAAAKGALGTVQGAAPAPAAAAGDPNSVQSRLPEIERFVEAHRGLKFKTPVRVVALDEGAFRTHIANATQSSKDLSALDHEAKELKALGLIGANVDVAKAQAALLGGAVVGLYDKKDKVLYVRGTQATPYVRQIMAHELTHALQDQWFGLDRPALDNDTVDEAGEAFLGLVEGDARRVEQAYRNSLSPADQAQAARQEAQISGSLDPSVPQVLVDILVFPYDVGPQFVTALLAAGGQAGLDAAFANPPTTTQQLLLPATYLAGQGPLAVAWPPADGPEFDRSVLGEVGLVLLLEETNDTAHARAAADEWGGDRYVAWQTGTRVCVRANIVVRGSGSVLRAALDQWVRQQPHATLGGTGQIVLTSCAG